MRKEHKEISIKEVKLHHTATLSRSDNVRLPTDRQHAVGQTLEFIRGAQHYDGAAALNELRQRVEAYTDPAGLAAINELAEHLPVLEALWLRFAAQATKEGGADKRAKLLRMALQAQNAYARTLTLVQGLVQQQQQQQARVMVNDA